MDRKNRREFIEMSALCAGAALTGCVSGRAAPGPDAKDGDYRAILLHLGQNMWCDWYPKETDVSALKDGLPDRKLRCGEPGGHQARRGSAGCRGNALLSPILAGALSS